MKDVTQRRDFLKLMAAAAIGWQSGTSGIADVGASNAAEQSPDAAVESSEMKALRRPFLGTASR